MDLILPVEQNRFKAPGAFFVLLALGIAVRIAAAWYSQGIHHPDEHQQYLEQAFRRVHGYGMTFWEQDEGLRHPLYHVTLGYGLAGLEMLGIQDPFVLAAVLRGVQALLVYSCMVAVAWSLLRSGQTHAALFLMFLLAFATEFVYIHVRTLSENAMTIPLLVALLCGRRRPAATGIALALMVALRLQALILVFGFGLASLVIDWQNWRRAGSSWREAFATTFWLSVGLALGFLLMGWMDYLAHGAWFHSTIANIQANILEGKAASFGTLPGYYYVVRGAWALALTSVLIIPLVFMGTWQRPALAWLVLLFVGAHSLIGHKEYRFLWGILPLVCILAAVGFQTMCDHWPARRRALAAIVAASILVTGAARVFFAPWREDPFHGTALALREVGTCHDVSGVAVTGTISSGGGNYFYLRRNVALAYYTPDELAQLLNDTRSTTGPINYVIASPERTPVVARLPVRIVQQRDGWTIFRVDISMHADATRPDGR